MQCQLGRRAIELARQDHRPDQGPIEFGVGHTQFTRLGQFLHRAGGIARLQIGPAEQQAGSAIVDVVLEQAFQIDNRIRILLGSKGGSRAREQRARVTTAALVEKISQHDACGEREQQCDDPPSTAAVSPMTPARGCARTGVSSACVQFRSCLLEPS